MLSANDIEEKIRSFFPEARIRARDMTGGGDHWQVQISAREFEGISLIDQHKLVYKSLAQWMNKEIHALSLDTKPLSKDKV